jgi:PPOX class probable F420-dependent enzyme
MPQSLPEPLAGLLRGASLCFISTVMPDGSPQLTQTWADTDGTHILINTAEGFQKVRNIRRDPRVAVAMADPGKPMLYYSVRGEVSSIAAVGAADHVEQLSQRYFGQPFPWPNGRDEVRLILTINARKVFTPIVASR